MELAYTLHRIGMGKGVTVEPKQVVEMTEAQIKELIPFGAVREPTEEEVALYRLANPVEASLPEVSKSTDDLDVLKARATELGVEFSGNIGIKKLAERVAEAEEAALLGN